VHYCMLLKYTYKCYFDITVESWLIHYPVAAKLLHMSKSKLDISLSSSVSSVLNAYSIV
jgi:hypothetical protein